MTKCPLKFLNWSKIWLAPWERSLRDVYLAFLRPTTKNNRSEERLWNFHQKKNCLSLLQPRKSLNFFQLSFYNCKTWVWSSLHHFNTVTVTNSPIYRTVLFWRIKFQLLTLIHTYVLLTKHMRPKQLPTCGFSHMIKCKSVTRQGSWEVIWGSRLPSAKVQAIVSHSVNVGQVWILASTPLYSSLHDLKSFSPRTAASLSSQNSTYM